RILRRGALALVVLTAEIPAVALVGVIDAIMPMAARGRRAFRRGQTIVGGSLGAQIRDAGEIGSCKNTGEDGRDEFRCTVWHVYPRDVTRRFTLQTSGKTWVAMSRKSGADRA